ncbi:hypothetical protein [Streptomyces asoensis]|uniref:Lipoprotein n=1 Tax=Streptomyces asoensis TaxID=249586 RepID=A0ABQ3RZ90_9ACTN|nr:hypothetical protein [Streptomyces asoensis]GGQ48715.1 hypothetical protein GCM10010496_08750 [Streptomyces asoensis]GHI61067.1 hypothetical protein Saso_27170 [Streptomyces asoensis]
MRTRATITTAALLLAALTACSSGSSSTATDTPSPASDTGTPAAEPTVSVPADHKGDDLAAAVAVYTAAYFAADVDTGYGMLSARCTKQIDEAMYRGILEQAKTDYGPDHPATDVQAEVAGGLGRATYKVKGLPKFDQAKQPWALEGGAWKYDAC